MPGDELWNVNPGQNQCGENETKEANCNKLGPFNSLNSPQSYNFLGEPLKLK
jgi:hypothetical protein